MLKPITTSVYTFSNLREGEFVYVDKTATIRELIRPKFAQYFCAPTRWSSSGRRSAPEWRARHVATELIIHMAILFPLRFQS